MRCACSIPTGPISKPTDASWHTTANRNCRAHGPRMNSPPKGRSLSAHWVPDNLRVVRETRPYVPTYCWSMTLIRTRIPRTRTSSRSAGTGGENALYPTRSISEPTLVIFCGNIIAKDCCVVRAGEMADSWDIVNIRDKNGFSTWPEKNSEEDIDRTLSKNIQKGGTGRIFQQPDFRGRGIRKHCIRQGSGTLQIQVPRGVWRPGTGRKQG